MTIALIGFAVLILLCFFGFRVGFATLIVGVVGFAYLRGWSASFAMAGTQIMEDAMSYNLSVIPLFILMGVFIYKAEISNDLFDAAYAGLGQFRGGLALSTVVACAGFSAVCGSSLATAATMTKVSLPPMQRYKYSNSLASGTIAAGGTLGIMIPPSVPLVIYGIVAEQDIGLLFMAGIIPGLLLVCLFMIAVAFVVRLDPEAGPAGDPLSPEKKRRALRSVGPILFLFVLVLGGIYGSVFTPTEASGIGAVGAALIALSRGFLWKLSEWLDALVEATKTTASLFMCIFGALVFAQFINLSGMPFDLIFIVDDLGLSATQLVMFVALIAVIMGMIFESIGILLLLVPVFLPSLYQADVNMIWFGIIVVIVTELGLITPPIGMNVFVVKSVAPSVPLGRIFVGVIPFIAAIFVGLILVFVFPQLAMFLPGLMR
jgi:tripartite ATP-independent transporter DctM subunit